jgi:conjugal transfer pilus assembly protein TraD
MRVLEHGIEFLLFAVCFVIVGGHLLARTLRKRHLRWTWALLGLPAGVFVMAVSPWFAWPVWLAAVRACFIGGHWHREDLEHGADRAEIARARLGVRDLIARRRHERAIARDGWIKDGRLAVGREQRGLPVSIPVGYDSGSHTLVVGATGSGKTVSQAWVVCRLIEEGHGAVVIDPKGDRMLREELSAAARRRGVRFLEWTPQGPLAYNPYAHGSDTEIADKALSGELFTEPHYLRQAQRYLGHAVRVMRAAAIPVTPGSLMEHLDPLQLELSTRALSEQQASETVRYLDSLTDRQQRDLAGVRDRLSILAESDTRRWLDPGQADELDLHKAVEESAVVYFRLDSDRRPLLAGMLAAAIVSDLITLASHLQDTPIPTAVMIDEFSAIAAEHVARLFGRARGAGFSLILGTQELADLKSAGEGALREQVLGNLQALIAHRQNVPESAELIAAMAGTKAAWITTQQTDDGLLYNAPSGQGTRRRGYEYEIHPSHIKTLKTGQAAIITPGSGPPAVAQIHHPNKAHQ